MKINALYLRNFRNYQEICVNFCPQINLIWGDNAQGKTNLVEALYLFIMGRSFRTAHISDLIGFGHPFFYLELLFEKNGIEQSLKFYFDGNIRKITHNATPLSTSNALIGLIHGVILSPEDRSLIKGGPSHRRAFLDGLLSQAKPLYLHHLCRYLKAMKQRNFLLKQRSLQTIAIWEEQMAISAAYLTQLRHHAIAELNVLAQNEMLGSYPLQLIYRSMGSFEIMDNLKTLQTLFLRQLAKQRSRECALGITLSGPHRDDISILIHNKDARQFASEGEQKSCVAAIKLAEWKWLATLCDQSPILCIDDVGVSLDVTKEHALYKRLERVGQVFVTSAREPTLSCYSIRIKNGNLIF